MKRSRPLTFVQVLKRPEIWARYWLMVSYQVHITGQLFLLTGHQFRLLNECMRRTNAWRKGRHAEWITQEMLEKGVNYVPKRMDYPLVTRMAASVLPGKLYVA